MAKQEQFHLAMRDVIEGLLQWRVWLLMSWQDIKLRYRRSALGPFWLTLSMAITAYSMGFLYGQLFKMDLKFYFPFLAAGILTWGLISITINESVTALVDASSYLKQIKLPYIVFIMRVVTRNLIIFAHNILAIIPILIFYHISLGWGFLMLFVGLLIIAINGVAYGLILGMLGARFRDIGPIVLSLVQVVFFITPIMWPQKILPAKYMILVRYNPFAQYVNLIREPIMGTIPSLYTYGVTLGYTLFGILLMLWVFSRSRHRIVYWL